MKIVVDSSSAILFFKIKVWHQILSFYEVWFAGAVAKELIKLNYEGGKFFADAVKKNVIKTFILDQENQRNLQQKKELVSMDKGEQESIFIFQNNNFDLFLTDDKQAVKYCYKKHLKFTNALLFLKILNYQRIISKTEFEQKKDKLLLIAFYSGYVKKFVSEFKIEDYSAFIGSKE